MLVIGNKKYRNLQEQVGWNTEQIDKIFEFLDGINVSDNVVVVLDITTPLTAEELEIVNREVAFIVYNGELYFKRNQDSSYIYFDIIFQVTSGTVITLTSSEISVTKSNGALGITNSTDYIYSKTQVDSLLSAKADSSYVSAQLALKANLAGANFTGAITAPSIIENMSGYSASILSNAGLTEEAIYIGAVKNGNKLTLVVAMNLTKNETLSGSKNICDIVVPASIFSKLYPTAIGGYLGLLDYIALNGIDEDGQFINLKALIYKEGSNKVRFGIHSSTIDNLTLNKKTYIRIESTFLLSDNLAS